MENVLFAHKQLAFAVHIGHSGWLKVRAAVAWLKVFMCVLMLLFFPIHSKQVYWTQIDCYKKTGNALRYVLQFEQRLRMLKCLRTMATQCLWGFHQLFSMNSYIFVYFRWRRYIIPHCSSGQMKQSHYEWITFNWNIVILWSKISCRQFHETTSKKVFQLNDCACHFRCIKVYVFRSFWPFQIKRLNILNWFVYSLVGRLQQRSFFLWFALAWKSFLCFLQKTGNA